MLSRKRLKMLCQAIRPSVMTFKGIVPLIVTVKNIVLKWKWNQQSIYKRKSYPLEQGCPWTEHVFWRLVPLIVTVESRILKSKWIQQNILKEIPDWNFWSFLVLLVGERLSFFWMKPVLRQLVPLVWWWKVGLLVEMQ